MQTRSNGVSWTSSVIATLLLLLTVIGGCGGGEESAEETRTPQAFDLRAEIDIRRERVEGSLEGVGFEVEAKGETGAQARFWWEGDEDTVLTVTIEGPAVGSMEWKDEQLSGYGALTAAQEQALVDLEQTLPAMTVARIPLDLACRKGAGELPAAVGAALLMPTQMSLKYRTPSSHLASAVARMAAQSECQHFRGPLETIDPDRLPAPGIVALSDEAPIPMAAGYFPFDGEGTR